VPSKQAAQDFDVERSRFRSEVSWRLGSSIRSRSPKKFAALEGLNVSEDINRSWENIKGNMKTSAKEILGLYEFEHEDILRFLEQILLFLSLALQPTRGFSLLSDSFPFCSFFTLLSPPSYSYYLHIFFDIYKPSLPSSPFNSRTYRFPGHAAGGAFG
jgi:hypothetical protein